MQNAIQPLVHMLMSTLLWVVPFMVVAALLGSPWGKGHVGEWFVRFEQLEDRDVLRLLSGSPRSEGTQLEGHAPKGSLQAFLPDRQITGDRAVAEWVVQAPPGTMLGLSARADRAGAVSTELRLG